MGQRGFSLVEVMITVAIFALFAAGAVELAAGAHPAAAASAATQFESAVTYARALAAAGPNGATLVVGPGALAIYSGRPTAVAQLSPAPVAPVQFAGIAVSEATAGSGPLALFFDGEGRISVAAFSGTTPAPMPTEPPCPPAGRWEVAFQDARFRALRDFGCAAP